MNVRNALINIKLLSFSKLYLCFIILYSPLVSAASADVINNIVETASKKRVVQLGESGHGMRETYQLKLSIVKQLHENKGFDILALEGGYAECWSAANTLEISAADMMFDCFWDTWANSDAQKLFEYVKSTQNSARPLKIVGFDNMPTSDAFLRYLKLHHSNSNDLIEAEVSFQRIYQGQFESTDELNKLQQKVKNEFSAFIDKRSDTSLKNLIKLRLDSVDFSAEEFSRSYMEQLREKLMAKNVVQLSKQFTDKKIIVWAHNAHVSHAQSMYIEGPKRQGEFVYEQLKGELYTIGIYPYGGEGYLWFTKSNHPISMHPDNSLERKLAELEGEIVFIDLNTDKPIWADSHLNSFEWGVNINSIVPSKMYHGLILIRNVTPITVIKR